MDVNDLKTMMDVLSQSSLSEIEFEDGGIRVRLTRKRPAGHPSGEEKVRPTRRTDEASFLSSRQVEAAAPLRISAPTFGCIFRAPSSDEPPYVSIGSIVKVGQTVAIAEAMKTMTPIMSDTDGVVAAILFEDGAMIEEGQTIFELDPA